MPMAYLARRYACRHWVKVLTLFVIIFVFLQSTIILRGQHVQEDNYQSEEGCRLNRHSDRFVQPLPIEYSERHRRVESTNRFTRAGKVDRMILHASTRTAYCVIPKSGCTFWVSVFRFMNNDTGGGSYRHPLEMTRVHVHSEKPSVTTFSSIHDPSERPSNLDDYFRFIFVRNPYSRIWSAYIDKFFLLDFWITEVPNFLAFWKEEEDRQLGAEAKKARLRRIFGKCGEDVSFAEFLTYVAAKGEREPERLNGHWRPVEHLCSANYFCPHFVGHVETFQQDSAYVLARMNMSWLLHAPMLQPELYQMNILVEDNFRQLDPTLSADLALYSSCTNVSDITRRLLRAFEMYGYLPTGWIFPQDEFDEDPTAEKFKAIVSRAYRSFTPEVRRQLAKQRKNEMERAYRSVPVEVLERISQLYLYEFLTFDYEMRPPNLFSVRYAS